jgi:hypothetical protein
MNEKTKGRGRPKSPDSLTERILVRLEKAQKTALAEYTKQTGLGPESTVVRLILIEKLRQEGFLRDTKRRSP